MLRRPRSLPPLRQSRPSTPQAASAAAGAAETFTIKPDCDDIREVILVRNGSTDKTVTVYFECNENAPRADDGSTDNRAGTECAIAVDSALLKKADGGFSLVAVPPADTALSGCSFSVASLGMRQTPLY